MKSCYPEDIYSNFQPEYYPHEHLGPVPFNPVPPPPAPASEDDKNGKKVGYKDNEQRPICRPPYLAPLPPQLPPKHTQIKPRCFTCKHFEMCKYKKDYLKTVTLIQNCLGDPAKDLELVHNYIVIPKFSGFPMIDFEKYFPDEIIFDNSEDNGKLFAVRFDGINYVNAVYKSGKYYILIKLNYDENSELYELKSCQEAFFEVNYELNKDSLETIQLGLMEWRPQIINAKRLPPPRHHHPDIINTTHFSGLIDCDMYEWTKDSYEDAIKKLIRKYPDGIPITDDGRALYHIATYHIADREVPYAPLFFEEKDKKHNPYFPPSPAPWNPKPPKRRGDF